METFKAYLLMVGFVGVLGFGGYWAATSLGEPTRIAETNHIKVIAQTQVSTIQDRTPVETQTPETTTPVETTTPKTTVEASGSHTKLIADLEKLITDNVLMKEGSRGTRVGSVQEFLNLYNNTSNGVDNDYGTGTKAKVLAFQKAVSLNADGQSGPDTYKKMIEWLKSN